MDPEVSHHKNDAAVDLKGQDQLDTGGMPTLLQWRTVESNRLLLEDRKVLVIPILFRFIAAAALAVHVPMIWVLVWVALVFGTHYWLQVAISSYAVQLAVNRQTLVMTPKMEAIVSNYKSAWLSNCLAWSGLSLLSQIWLPLEMRVFCIVILNALMFIGITRSYMDRPLMHKVSVIMIVSQLLFVTVRVVIEGTKDMVVPHALLYMFYLVLMSYLLWAVGNRFNRMHLKRLDSEYVKLQLIETLNQNKAQLYLEQQALVASNKLVQQFYSGAAHDLRQPVYAMQLYASMLQDDSSLGKVLLPKITQSCESINDMFNTLFDYQQTHMNDTELVEKEIKIQETFRSLALHFQPIAAAKGLEIRFRPIAGAVTMVPLYLTRILSNLISNAVRYTNTGGVLLAARKTQSGIQFEVWDTGIGIDVSKTEQIFNEFYKVNKIDLENEGLGLGLAIAKQLAARIPKAAISVHSRVGRGSVFRFTVPLDLYIEAQGSQQS